MDEKRAAAAFAALSQETRVRLLRLLAETGASGMRAGELQARLGVPSSTLSFHLSALEQAGLVHATKRGRMMIYALRIAGLRDLLPADDEEALAITPSFNVLFVCTHNSARSIMAEAILDKLGNGQFHAYSAGSEPVAKPNEEVITNLKHLGHDVSRLRSKSWNEFTGAHAPRMDFIIALCDTSQGQACPEFGDRAVTASWPLPDPTKFSGTGPERHVLLNQLYCMIQRRLEIFCSLPFGSLDRMSLKARLDELGYSTPAKA